LGSNKKRLTIREIYAAMEKKYAYFRSAGPTWKVSKTPLFHSLILDVITAAICSPPPVLE
jgi:hypothetical protein